MRWHYTTLSKLPLIIQSGRLIALEGAQQRATVWFSSNDAWEPTASKGISFETDSGPIHRTATIDEMFELAGGPVRIGVEDSTAPYDWEDYKKFSGQPQSYGGDFIRPDWPVAHSQANGLVHSSRCRHRNG